MNLILIHSELLVLLLLNTYYFSSFNESGIKPIFSSNLFAILNITSSFITGHVIFTATGISSTNPDGIVIDGKPPKLAIAKCSAYNKYFSDNVSAFSSKWGAIDSVAGTI